MVSYLNIPTFFKPDCMRQKMVSYFFNVSHRSVKYNIIQNRCHHGLIVSNTIGESEQKPMVSRLHPNTTVYILSKWNLDAGLCSFPIRTTYSYFTKWWVNFKSLSRITTQIQWLSKGDKYYLSMHWSQLKMLRELKSINQQASQSPLSLNPWVNVTYTSSFTHTLIKSQTCHNKRSKND